jgi:hypothetical protein
VCDDDDYDDDDEHTRFQSNSVETAWNVPVFLASGEGFDAAVDRLARPHFVGLSLNLVSAWPDPGSFASLCVNPAKRLD